MTGPWDVRAGRRWVVVANYGEETHVTFCADRQEAARLYRAEVDEGANAFFAETIRVHMNPEKP